MALDYKERIGDQQQAISLAIDSALAGVWTALPGVIQSFDPVAVTVVVQPAIQGVVRQPDGSAKAVNLPLLLDVPVVFPRGGGATLTFPILPRDECLVVFSSRCIDAWWQSGGVQIPMEMRMHDLSDGFALPGPFSQAQRIGGISTSSVQLRSNDGGTYIDLNPATEKVKIVAPGGFEVDAPASLFSGTVTIQGLLTFLAGMVGSAATGAAAVITGTFQFIGQVFANGKKIDDGHTHKGVQPGSGNSGTVN
ncbi:Gp138 family membrane-puncturing spike protein [Chromobacterium violaceum]|uniref:Gp138 family membrane-puncturing spike protein n=1 Tax=Chromobacterium violaceum TaxID=536 RepID=UPI0005B8FC37|nr:Gp138 family membrane-puncturing spike protein [Chromobacterium violaceum]